MLWCSLLVLCAAEPMVYTGVHSRMANAPPFGANLAQHVQGANLGQICSDIQLSSPAANIAAPENAVVDFDLWVPKLVDRFDAYAGLIIDSPVLDASDSAILTRHQQARAQVNLLAHYRGVGEQSGVRLQLAGLWRVGGLSLGLHTFSAAVAVTSRPVGATPVPGDLVVCETNAVQFRVVRPTLQVIQPFEGELITGLPGFQLRVSLTGLQMPQDGYICFRIGSKSDCTGSSAFQINSLAPGMHNVRISLVSHAANGRVVLQTSVRRFSFVRGAAIAGTVPHVNEPRVKQWKYGRMMYMLNDVVVGRSIDLYGEYQEEQIALLREIVQEGDTVIDVDAHIGQFTIPFARMVGPKGQVHAFEAQPAMFQLLNGNLALNALHNTVTHSAVSGIPPNRFWEINYSEHRDFRHAFLRADQESAVARWDLDGLLMDTIKQLQLVCIGTNSADLNVLRGAQQLLSKHRPVVYIQNSRAANVLQSARWMSRMRYQCHWVPQQASLFRQANFARSSIDISTDVNMYHLLCTPAEQILW